MLGMVTQTSVYHWLIEGKTSLHFLNVFVFFFCLFFLLAQISIVYFYCNLVYISKCIIFLGDSEPTKVFERTANLANNQIINYRCDPSEKWLVLIGIAPGSPEVGGHIVG